MADKLETLLSVASDALKAEDEVKDRLGGGAEKYVAVIGALLAFRLVDLKDMSFTKATAQTAFSYAALAGLVLLLAALAAVLWGMRVGKYPTFPKSPELWCIGTAANDDDAKATAVNVYLDLRDAVRAANERRASTFRIAGFLLLAGVVISILAQLGLSLKFH